MAKTKHKIEEASNPAQSKERVLSKPQMSSDDEQLLAFWSAEIGALKDQKFESVEQACDAIVDGVIVRLQLGKADADQVRMMMKLMFETDPALLNEIRTIFNIG